MKHANMYIDVIDLGQRYRVTFLMCTFSFTRSWDNRLYTQIILAVPGYAHAPFSPNFLTGFCSDGPSECTGQIWSLLYFTRSWYNSNWSFGWGCETPTVGFPTYAVLIHQRHRRTDGQTDRRTTCNRNCLSLWRINTDDDIRYGMVQEPCIFLDQKK